MLTAQPPTEPIGDVAIHGAIGRADRTETEVTGPTDQAAVESLDYLRRFPIQRTLARHLADGVAQLANLRLGRARADVGSSRLLRVATTERITQKVERFRRNPTQLRLPLVHRQLQPTHHVAHSLGGPQGRTAATDHEVVGIIDDASLSAGASKAAGGGRNGWRPGCEVLIIAKDVSIGKRVRQIRRDGARPSSRVLPCVIGRFKTGQPGALQTSHS